MPALWWLLSFFLGALPFAVWMGRWKGFDPRQVGDHNPGAINTMRSGGVISGVVVLLLDTAKAAFPVGMAYHMFQWRDGWMFAIAIAPVLGHAFSPFLRGRGGKAVATCLGVWIGLTIWDAPLIALASISLATLFLTPSGWAVLTALLALAGYFLMLGASPLLWAVLAFQVVLLSWKYRADLRKRPHLRFGNQRRRP